MADIFINDSGLKGEISNTRKTNTAISSLKYDIQKNNLVMQSIDKYIECLESLNEAMKSFATLTEADIHTLEIIRGELMGLDKNIASKDLFGKAYSDPTSDHSSGGSNF